MNGADKRMNAVWDQKYALEQVFGVTLVVPEGTLQS